MNETVRIALPGRTVVITWEEREALVARLRRAVEAFERVGTSRPVVLGTGDAPVLLATLDAWAIEVGAEGLPGGVAELLAALRR
jgi:hypothetical protein